MTIARLINLTLYCIVLSILMFTKGLFICHEPGLLGSSLEWNELFLCSSLPQLYPVSVG